MVRQNRILCQTYLRSFPNIEETEVDAEAIPFCTDSIWKFGRLFKFSQCPSCLMRRFSWLRTASPHIVVGVPNPCYRAMHCPISRFLFNFPCWYVGGFLVPGLSRPASRWLILVMLIIVVLLCGPPLSFAPKQLRTLWKFSALFCIDIGRSR